VLHAEQIIVPYVATLLQVRKEDEGEERRKLLGVGVVAVMMRFGRWLKGRRWKEWSSTLIIGRKGRVLQRRERDVRGGYSVTGEGMS
jgi:hypothetical protein